MFFNIPNNSFCILLCLFISSSVVKAVTTRSTVPSEVETVLKNSNISAIRQVLNDTRRIIKGEDSFATRPYMVYLKLPNSSPKYRDYKTWLCGGVIVHEEYIITSAACIEDAKRFYIVAGTYKHTIGEDRYNNLCIKNGAKKAIWKCVPRNYVFDGHENDNLRWMNNDIAIVKVEDEFDFSRKVKGCDFVPRPICYNNQSGDYEKPGNEALIAGWGTTEKYTDWVNTRRVNELTQNLLETKVEIVPKKRCKLRWGSRYHNIIDNYMICSKDINSDPSELCNEKYVDCVDIFYEDEEENGRRMISVPVDQRVHSAHHNTSDAHRRSGGRYGGFCEMTSCHQTKQDIVRSTILAANVKWLSIPFMDSNDHGGPMIYGTGSNSVVIGIISACLVKERTNKCYGPFLYTSIWKNRNLINCAIYKDTAPNCNKLFRASETHEETEMSWADHPDGPAKSEINNLKINSTATTEKNTTKINK